MFSKMSIVLSRLKEVHQFRRTLSSFALHDRLDHQARIRGERVAIIDDTSSWTYSRLAAGSDKVARALKDEGVEEGNVAFLCGNDASYAISQFGIWKSGNSCVPLFKSHPTKSLEYYVDDSRSRIIIASKSYADKVFPLVKESCERKLLIFEDLLSTGSSDTNQTLESKIAIDSDALVIYTSGTTGSPKGVVATHRILASQVDNLIEAWNYSENDCLLHVLPLHHTHGIVNCLLCPIAVGGRVNMMQSFDPEGVWKHLLFSEDNEERNVNLFMAVPTVYAKLIEYYQQNLDPQNLFLGKSKEAIRTICQKKIRLMVSGSAALPQPILESWQNITSHFLLERYGMTELGMALTNPLTVTGRRAGCVGKPFPNVRARIVAAGTDEVLAEADSTNVQVFSANPTGDLQVQGPNVFKCYYNRPDATSKEFTADGWFKTGDTAAIDNGDFKILGRSSVDIIKSGGYKISALDIERILLSHPSVKEIAVVGVEDLTWGQKVGAVVVLNPDTELELSALRDWSKDQMPSYSIPTLIKIMSDLPKNAMGKINKKELVKVAFPL